MLLVLLVLLVLPLVHATAALHGSLRRAAAVLERYDAQARSSAAHQTCAPVPNALSGLPSGAGMQVRRVAAAAPTT